MRNCAIRRRTVCAIEQVAEGREQVAGNATARVPVSLRTVSTMHRHIAQLALVVADYDEAITFYTRKLGFELVEDTRLSDTKRWVVVAPPGGQGCRLLLAKAATEEQRGRVGDQTGGRVFLFMHTDDLLRDHAELLRQGVTIVRPPTEEAWGSVLVFTDLYGNLWDLIQPREEGGV